MKRIYLGLLFASLIFLSCREEIIPPDNFSGNINQPLIIKTNNSYTFTINAVNLSFDIYEKLDFTSAFTGVNNYINGYSKGEGNISMLDLNSEPVYEQNLQLNASGEIEGEIVETIRISLTDFTGNFKVQIYRLK